MNEKLPESFEVIELTEEQKTNLYNKFREREKEREVIGTIKFKDLVKKGD